MKCYLCETEEEETKFVSLRTSGAAKVCCEDCQKVLIEKYRKQGTKYIATPYISVNAAKSIRG